ncbi:Major facilitator, sugar transporter-like [Dillenia turbinata]|uniref:Major facilitator, sugar transporter-like n=1 Tax=Dillenia turbinata TaxID=194707 RepID=A0AAN8YUB7_9MAGN
MWRVDMDRQIVVLSTVRNGENEMAGIRGSDPWTGYSSQAESGIMKDLGLSLAEYSVFGSILTVGGMIGAIICGKLMDLFGRKGTMSFAEGFCIMGWLAIAFSQGAWLLYLGRLSLGIGNAILYYVVPVYIAEISLKHFRGGFVALNQNMINWGLLALIGAIPPLLQFLGLFLIPESPRWLESPIFLDMLLLLSNNVSNSLLDPGLNRKPQTATKKPVSRCFPEKICPCTSCKHSRENSVGVGLMALQQLSGEKGIAYYASSIFTTAGTIKPIPIHETDSAIGTTAMAIIQIPSTGLAIPLIDILGRRPLLLDFQWWNDTTPTLVFIGILIFSAAFTFGMSGVPWAIMSEIFPINIKASAGSLANATSWFLSWVVSYSFNFMMEWSSTGTFFIFACICGLTVLFVAKLVPETKGRTLEEIQVSVTRSSQEENENAIGNGEVVLGDSSSSATVTLYLSTMVAVCGTFGPGCSAGYTSQAESGIMEELGLTVAEAMSFAEGFCIMGWLAIAFSQGAWLLYLGRLSLGIGNAILYYVVPVYIAEISPKYFRGGFVALNQFVYCCGMSTIFFVGNMINWRLLALIGAIPPLLQFLGLFLIPESPRWLAKIGQEEGCKFIIQRLRGENADITQEVADIRDYIESLKLQPGNQFLDVFQRKYAHALLVGVGLMALQQLSGEKGIAYYASSIFTAAGTIRPKPINETDKLIKILDRKAHENLFILAGFSSAIGTTAMAIIQIPSTGLAIPLIDILGRRPLLLASAVGTTFACSLIGMSFLFEDFQWWNDTTPTLVFIGILIFSAAFTFGMSGVPWAIMSEIFPINIKASAGSLANATSWFLSWVVSYSFNFMMEWSSTGTFFIFACICGLTVPFVAKLVPETKGRTLEEIQVSVTRSSQEESSAEAL